MDMGLEKFTATEEAQWNSTPAFKLPGWAEPLVQTHIDREGVS